MSADLCIGIYFIGLVGLLGAFVWWHEKQETPKEEIPNLFPALALWPVMILFLICLAIGALVLIGLRKI